MNTAIKIPKDIWPQAIYAVLMPIFFMCFNLLYNPFDIKGFYNLGGFSYGFHLTMLSCIILLSIALTRGLLLLVRIKKEMKWWEYTLWCIGEVFVASCFMALYTTLFSAGSQPFFQSLATCMKFSFLVLLYPYIFLVMLHIITSKSAEIESKETAAEQGALVKFYDEHNRLKLTIDSNSVLCIKANYNYLEVSYLEIGKVRTFSFRNSMKSQEENAARHGLVRCHRSYFINPKHVKMLSKDSNGVFAAVLDTEEPVYVPVSKQNYEALASIL